MGSTRAACLRQGTGRDGRSKTTTPTPGGRRTGASSSTSATRARAVARRLRLSEACWAAAALLFGVAAAACKAAGGDVYDCDCTYLTDFDDLSKHAVTV